MSPLVVSYPPFDVHTLLVVLNQRTQTGCILKTNSMIWTKAYLPSTTNTTHYIHQLYSQKRLSYGHESEYLVNVWEPKKIAHQNKLNNIAYMLVRNFFIMAIKQQTFERKFQFNDELKLLGIFSFTFPGDKLSFIILLGTLLTTFELLIYLQLKNLTGVIDTRMHWCKYAQTHKVTQK